MPPTRLAKVETSPFISQPPLSSPARSPAAKIAAQKHPRYEKCGLGVPRPDSAATRCRRRWSSPASSSRSRRRRWRWRCCCGCFGNRAVEVGFGWAACTDGELCNGRRLPPRAGDCPAHLRGLILHESTPGSQRAGVIYVALAVLSEAFLLMAFVFMAEAA